MTSEGWDTSSDRADPTEFVPDLLGFNLTRAAGRGSLLPVIGLEDEIQQVMQVLSRPTKNNPMLIGQRGVGKTVVTYGVTHAILSPDVPPMLKDKELCIFDPPWRLIADRTASTLKLDRLLTVIRSRNVLLVCAGLDTLLTAESESDGRPGPLRTALVSGDFQMIADGGPALGDLMLRDQELASVFQTIEVAPASPSEAVDILFALRPFFEDFHRARIVDRAVHAAVELTASGWQGEQLPGAAIDLIYRAGAYLRRRDLAQGTRARERPSEGDPAPAIDADLVRQIFAQADQG